MLLKLYVHGYLNRLQSSRRLERETQRNVELMWLTGRLAPDFKTIVDFRKANGKAIRNVCREFIVPCRRLDLLSLARHSGCQIKVLRTKCFQLMSANVHKKPRRDRYH